MTPADIYMMKNGFVMGKGGEKLSDTKHLF